MYISTVKMDNKKSGTAATVTTLIAKNAVGDSVNFVFLSNKWRQCVNIISIIFDSKLKYLLCIDACDSVL